MRPTLNIQRVFCALDRHEAALRRISNEGRRFSRCTGCGSDLVETSQGWCTPPQGYRIVWKPIERQFEALPAEPGRNQGRKRRNRRHAKFRGGGLSTSPSATVEGAAPLQ